MDLQKLKRQLAREASEYLADLRALKEELRSLEGWIALALVLVSALIMVAWAVVSLGFSPPNDHVSQFIWKLGLRECRPVSNFSGIVIFINLFLMLFLMAVSVGNVLNMISRVKRKLSREPRDLIVTSLLMVTIGVGGIIYMRMIC